MKETIFLAAMAIASVNTQAQKLFTLEELNFGGKNYKDNVPASLKAHWNGNDLIERDGENYFKYVLPTGKKVGTEKPVSDVVKIAEGYRGLEYCKASRTWAALKDDNLYVQTADGAPVQLSTDGSREIVYGQSVHRNEFGIRKGTFFSPDGKKLAFYRMDQTMVADYPQVNTFAREAAYEPDKYPMAGMTSHQVTVGIADVATGAVKYLDLGDVTDRYFTNISWSPDGSTLYLIEVNRDQTDAHLDAYDAASGSKIKTLYSEHNDKYCEPLHPITFLPWDSKKFVYWSQQDGYMHLYLMDVDGNIVKQLTKGEWIVSSIVGFNAKTKSIIYISNEVNPLQMNVYSVNVNSGRRTLLDNGKGVHSASLSEDGSYLLDQWSEPDVPRAYAVTNTKTAKSIEIFRADDPWKGYVQPIFESGKIKAADGVTDLYWRMVKPADFDPAKKYPTVVYVYGGPHAHNVDAAWHWKSRSWETYMAQKGYIVYILDNRGSENRGLAFEQATFRQLGQVEMQDQMKGVEYLKSLPYVDADRLGVHGWSFGGFMTISLLTNYPDVFKVGVAGGPVIDWKWYEVMYGERYMDTPESNPEGYEKASLLNRAKDLKGRLLVITGMNDNTVVPQHCLMFLNKCAEVGTYPDFFAYPGESHNMMGHKSVHLHEMITRYFEDFLK
ncbi:MAG: S9 family peptidase [Bacteroidales bacterium]|nr:S9 family peptidase [Bacteroidales bacterium]